jgi:hypothetical protein
LLFFYKKKKQYKKTHDKLFYVAAQRKESIMLEENTLPLEDQDKSKIITELRVGKRPVITILLHAFSHQFLQDLRREHAEAALELEKTRKLLTLQRDLTTEQEQRAEELEAHLQVVVVCLFKDFKSTFRVGRFKPRNTPQKCRS